MKLSRFFRTIAASSVAAVTLGLAQPVEAQWTTQPITLRPGWNAVFLEVQPEPRESDAVLAGLPVESVWRYNKSSSTVQFIKDPNELLKEPEAWLVWTPPSHPLASYFSLYAIEGGLPYLIKTTNSTPITWNLRGQPRNRKVEWLQDALNLAGFSLPASAPPSFASFFAGASSLTNFALYRLDSQGRWLTTASSSAMQRGEAFWMRAQGLPSFQGPIEVRLGRRAGLEFGRTLTEQFLRIYNASPSNRTVQVRVLPSENPPAGAAASLAGPVPLSYWQNDFAYNRVGWTNFPALVQSNLPPGGTWELRIEVRRRDMAPPPAGAISPLYQSLIEVIDSAGLFRQLVPVTAEGLQPASTAGAAGFAPADATPVHPRAGLWIGSASINAVSQPPSTVPVPTSSDFAFRLLVHVDATGQARLLQRIVQAWQPGTYRVADDGSGNKVLDQPGRFVLLTDGQLQAQVTGAALRDGQPVARRYSSAAFGFREPIPMGAAGDFGANGSAFSAQILLPYNDPLNPFVHAYHPDHNNRDDRQQPLPIQPGRPLPETRESWSIRRNVVLQFALADPDGLALAGWGDTQLGGTYSETISGLHKTNLVLRGTFRLHRSSLVPALNQ
jgi:hypothetical protein